MQRRDIRVTVKLRNNHLVQMREELGMTPQQFAEAIGVGYPTYLNYENMKASPLSKGRNRVGGPVGLSSVAEKICAFHGVGPEALWPDEMATIRVTKNAYSFSLSLDEAKRLAGAADKKLIGKEMARVLACCLERLAPRQQLIMACRFGLDREQMTLEETGEMMGVTRERVMQLENIALRKLRAMPEFQKEIEGG